MKLQLRHVVTAPVLVAVLVGGCATQPVERIERHHDLRIDVSKVDFGARGTLHIIQAQEPRLRVRARADVANLIHIEEDAGRLHIRDPIRPRFAATPELLGFGHVYDEQATYYLEIPALEELKLSGGAVRVGPFDGDGLAITSDGHADILVDDVDVSRFSLDTTMGSQVTVAGLVADSVVLAASGNATIRIKDVDANSVQIQAHGQSDISLEGRASNGSLTLSGSGSVTAPAWLADHADIHAEDQSRAVLCVRTKLFLDVADRAKVGSARRLSRNRCDEEVFRRSLRIGGTSCGCGRWDGLRSVRGCK